LLIKVCQFFTFNSFIFLFVVACWLIIDHKNYWVCLPSPRLTKQLKNLLTTVVM
jgi:hypothetical protein